MNAFNVGDRVVRTIGHGCIGDKGMVVETGNEKNNFTARVRVKWDKSGIRTWLQRSALRVEEAIKS